jgi:hypothetical protein
MEQTPVASHRSRSILMAMVASDVNMAPGPDRGNETAPLMLFRAPV